MEARLLKLENTLAALWSYGLSGTQLTRVLMDNSLAGRYTFTPSLGTKSTLVWALFLGPLALPAIIMVYGDTLDAVLGKAEAALAELQQAAESPPPVAPKRRSGGRKPTKLGRGVVPAA